MLTYLEIEKFARRKYFYHIQNNEKIIMKLQRLSASTVLFYGFKEIVIARTENQRSFPS
jgi:hypothetical protein